MQFSVLIFLVQVLRHILCVLCCVQSLQHDIHAQIFFSDISRCEEKSMDADLDGMIKDEKEVQLEGTLIYI